MDLLVRLYDLPALSPRIEALAASAHREVVFLGRHQVTGSGSLDGGSARLAMLQLHYYL